MSNLYQARHATFTGGTENFFLVLVARRAGGGSVLAVGDMDTYSVGLYFRTRNEEEIEKLDIR